MAEPTIWQEPIAIAAGDSLIFQRNLPNYLPSKGWSIQGTLTLPMPNGGGRVVAQFVSVPDSTNQYHLVNVPNFAAAIDAGNYIFSEEIVCAAGGESPGEKHQIYFNDNFNLGDNLAGGVGAAPLTEAQQMLAILYTSLKQLYVKQFSETDVQRNRFVIQKQAEVRKELQYWLAVRQNEVQIENVRNGRPSGAVSVPVFNIG